MQDVISTPVTTLDHTVAEAAPALTCFRHPQRETLVRCNRCGKPICYQCSVQTPVGYRCKECIRTQQAVFYNAQPHDLAVAGVVAVVLGTLVGLGAYLLLGMVGFYGYIAAFIGGPMVGEAIAQLVRRSVQRRRARYLNWVASGAAILGVLLGGIVMLFVLPGIEYGELISPSISVLGRLDVLLLAALMASTLFARLK